MTLQECYNAAMNCAQVTVDGTLYRRIIRAGYCFRENGSYIEFAEVLEMTTGTIRSVNPGAISLPPQEKTNYYKE